jgi:hypothetical protein
MTLSLSIEMSLPRLLDPEQHIGGKEFEKPRPLSIVRFLRQLGVCFDFGAVVEFVKLGREGGISLVLVVIGLAGRGDMIVTAIITSNVGSGPP